MQKKRYPIIFVLAVIGLLFGCQNVPDATSKIENKPISKKTGYTSIEEYAANIGTNMSTDKPKVKIYNQQVVISFKATFSRELEKKLQHTKKPSYYTVRSKTDQTNLDRLIDKNKLPLFRNDLKTLAKGGNYQYKIVLPLKKQPSAKEKQILMDGGNYEFLFLNEHKKVVNVMDFLDIGLP
ncbi:Uncharacterised protein [Listeria grayi]|nr:Uncharacterised protein [Listeria grayi]